MNKMWKFITGVGSKMGGKVKQLWSRVGAKSTSKIAAWASKNRGWLQTVGFSAVAAGTTALVTKLVSAYVDNKEQVASRWMENTNESTPERASFRKRQKCTSELRDLLNKYAAYGEGDHDNGYTETIVRMLELVNALAHNEADDEVRRIAVRASSIIPGCMEAGQVPEEGFSNPLVLRTIINLSEDAMSAEDIEGMVDCVLDIAEPGTPLKSI